MSSDPESSATDGRPYPLPMESPHEPAPAGDGAPDSILARVVTPVRHGLVTLSVIDTVAIGVSMWALVASNQRTTPNHLPLLVASLAASAVVLFSLPGLDIARSWNVIAGQFLGALSAIVCAALLGDDPAVVAGCAVALAFVLMRLAHALHPPGASTAMIIALVPADHAVRFLFFPVLAGAVTITLFAWLVHLAERLLLARVGQGRDPERAEAGPPTDQA